MALDNESVSPSYYGSVACTLENSAWRLDKIVKAATASNRSDTRCVGSQRECFRMHFPRGIPNIHHLSPSHSLYLFLTLSHTPIVAPCPSSIATVSSLFSQFIVVIIALVRFAWMGITSILGGCNESGTRYVAEHAWRNCEIEKNNVRTSEKRYMPVPKGKKRYVVVSTKKKNGLRKPLAFLRSCEPDSFQNHFRHVKLD